MKSRISIDYVDVEGKGIEPVIRVDRESSDDPRDKLIGVLFESTQNYLQIFYSFSNQPSPSTAEVLQRIYLRKPPNIEALESPYVSRFEIGDHADFATDDALEAAYQQAVKDNPDKKPHELEYIPEYKWGKIVAVKFTEAKVWYDMLDDYSGKIFKEIPSHNVKKLASEFSKEPK